MTTSNQHQQEFAKLRAVLKAARTDTTKALNSAFKRKGDADEVARANETLIQAKDSVWEAMKAADGTEMRFSERNATFDALKDEAILFLQLLDQHLRKLNKTTEPRKLNKAAQPTAVKRVVVIRAKDNAVLSELFGQSERADPASLQEMPVLKLR